jgi:hypothetical protein
MALKSELLEITPFILYPLGVTENTTAHMPMEKSLAIILLQRKNVPTSKDSLVHCAG